MKNKKILLFSVIFPLEHLRFVNLLYRISRLGGSGLQKSPVVREESGSAWVRYSEKAWGYGPPKLPRSRLGTAANSFDAMGRSGPTKVTLFPVRVLYFMHGLTCRGQVDLENIRLPRLPRISCRRAHALQVGGSRLRENLRREITEIFSTVKTFSDARKFFFVDYHV